MGINKIYIGSTDHMSKNICLEHIFVQPLHEHISNDGAWEAVVILSNLYDLHKILYYEWWNEYTRSSIEVYVS